MPTRYDRDIDVREPVIRKGPPPNKAVEGLWAIRDKRRNEITGYCYSEAHATVVAAHSQHFAVEYVKGPFEVPDGPPVKAEPIPEGRFRRIVEDET